MKIKFILAIALIFLASFVAYQSLCFTQEETSAVTGQAQKAEITYIQATPVTVTLATTPASSPFTEEYLTHLKKLPLQPFENPELVKSLSEILLNFDNLFKSYGAKSENSTINQIEIR